ncbi:histidine kinase [Novosphingobium sp.]|uniref:sensor histidine kinase n=1 Tax=Novosphingobium sp. TaxID=1874826 RepID=UPI0025FD737A|nr:histidine kinase [Novosphingobium sp.]MCC6927185.1 histidine kinase [Novosphingobium sp.]
MADQTIQPARVPTRTVLASIAGLWLCYLALITLRSALIDQMLFWEMLGLRSLVTLAGIVVTAMAWSILRLFDHHRVGVRMVIAAAVMLPAALALAVINTQVFKGIDQHNFKEQRNPSEVQIRHDTAGNVLVDIPDPPQLTAAQLAQLQKKFAEQGLWRQLTDIAIGRYFLLLAWAALYFAMVNAEQARAAERREGEYRRAAKAAELRSLRYQVNPHFLFNTLNSLSSLVLTGKGDAAERMIQSLSSFYRRSLADDPTSDSALDQELALQRAYLEIEAARFPDRLLTRFDVPAALEDARVPGLILQPLVENSVRYAVAPTSKPVTVTIAAREEYGRLVLEVSDNGPAPSESAAKGFGIGLANVRDRLAARYGDEASLSSGPDEGGGWRSVIRLPLERHG